MPKNEFQGYVKATLEGIKSDLTEVKETLKDHIKSCDDKIVCIEKEQSKIKGIYLGAAAVISAIVAAITKFIK